MNIAKFKSYILIILGVFATVSVSAQNPGKVKEVLIMHHSHLDVGFTHLQPVALELHKDFISQALTLLDITAGYPESSRLKWTCEVTEPVMLWLETASGNDIDRFANYLKQGRIVISALEYNTTPLASSEGLARQLYGAAELSKRFGVKINTANLHDATGLPWPIVDLLLDGGVELLTMGINLHLSGTPKPRPAVYRWQGPGGREIFVMNGEHYSMFDQWTDNHLKNLDTIQSGLNRYLKNLENLNYPYDFAYLTATCAPSAYDNAPPNFDLPELIRKWNEEGRSPRLKFVTPQDILERIKQIPVDSIPVVKGDWTDYWNFGAGSSATETRISLNTATNMATIDLLSAFGKTNKQLDVAMEKTWKDIKFYIEHTWGAYNPLELTNPFPTAQWNMKAYPAYEGMAYSKYAITKLLQQLAGNPHSYETIEGIMLVNTSGSAVTYYPQVPDEWRLKNKWIESWLMAGDRFDRSPATGKFYGPYTLEPYSWKKIPFTGMKTAIPETRIITGKNFIETDFYKLTFDPKTGQVTSLFDKKRKWEVTDKNSKYGFFQFVHEKPDPSVDSTRFAFHERSIENERIGLTAWKPDWKASYNKTSRLIECRIDTTAFTATLVIKSLAEGVKSLEQRITLHADSPVIDLAADFVKIENASPEAIYFTFPMNLDEGWRGYFDTGDVPVELDSEQIPGTCRDWVTVSSFASIHNNEKGATLYCPDAPLVMFGSFNFGRNQASIKRDKYPLLLAWAANNYWETNFRGSQPGLIQLKYAFNTQSEYNAATIALEAQKTINSPIVYQAVNCKEETSGQFLKLNTEGVKILYVKASEDKKGTIVRLLNLNDTEVSTELTFPSKKIFAAWHCSTQETKTKALEIENSKITINLKPREITSIRIE
jgi:alpha-mannosidase